MISICIILSNDKYFSKRKKIIFSALKDLLYNLNKKKIKSQIIIVDYGGNSNQINFDRLYKRKYNQVLFKYVKAKFKFNNSFLIGDALKIAINNADSENILLKGSDTFFNDEIYNFLKSNYNLKANFYCALRKDFKHTIFKNKKQFLSNKCMINKNVDFLMKKIKLHTNAVGDFILVKKNKINKIKYFHRYGFHIDTFIVGCLYFMGLKQKMIKNGFVYKILHNKTFVNRYKYIKPNSLILYLENNFFTKFKIKNYLIEILRAIFNYPKIKNKNYDSLSRLKLMIFLRYFNINFYPRTRNNQTESKIVSITKLNKIK